MIKPANTEFGHLLREACDAAGVTQAELARAINYNPATVSRVARGRSAPTARMTEAMAVALANYNVDATALVACARSLRVRQMVEAAQADGDAEALAVLAMRVCRDAQE